VLALPGEELRLLPLLVVAVVAVLVGSRIVFVLGYAAVSRRGDGRIGWREAVVLAWAGTRGPVSGLAAFSLPLGVGVEAAVDQSRLMQATTFVVIAVTLALSPTLGIVARMVGLKSDDLSDDERAVAVALATRGLDALDEAVRQAAEQRRPVPHGVESTLRARLAGDLERIEGSGEQVPEEPDGAGLEIAVLKAQQDELLRLRESGTPDAVIRPAMHALDLQLSALRTRRAGGSH
jgi:hypothetical protein